MSKSISLSTTEKNRINRKKAPYKIQHVNLVKNHIHGQFEELISESRTENNRPYPWNSIQVDESFVVPAATREQLDRVQAAVSGTAAKRFERNGEVYTTRIVKNGVRVYRLY